MFGCFLRVIRCFLRGIIDSECIVYIHSPTSTAKGLRSSFLASIYKSESITLRFIIAGKVRAFDRTVETSTFDLARVAINRNFSITCTNVFFYSSILSRIILSVDIIKVQRFQNTSINF